MDQQTKAKRAVFVGMARNCAWFLPAVLENIARLAELYRESAVVIVENDSSDGTKSILKSWLAAQQNGKLIELDGLAAAEPRRTQRIAIARNAALDYVRSSPMRTWDHLVLLDLDEVNAHPISCPGFEEAAAFLESDSATAAVFANQPIAYYDIWALRRDGWCETDCWKQIAARPKWLRLPSAEVIHVHARQIVIPEQAKPIQVESAFGGLAIYKLSLIGSCNYDGLDSEGREVCEHVVFNEQLSAAEKKLFIYPRLLNQASISHLFNAGRFGRRDALLLYFMRAWFTICPPWLKDFHKRKISRTAAGRDVPRR